MIKFDQSIKTLEATVHVIIDIKSPIIRKT